MKKYKLFALVLIFLLVNCKTEKKDISTLTRIGEKLPDFTVETLSGEIISTQSLAGNVSVINFFATWCPPCQEELPHLQEMWQARKSDNFKLLVIGREHSRSELETFALTGNFTFPIAPDPDRSIYKKFASQYIPRTYLLDTNGIIVMQTVGFTEKEFQSLLNKIDELLNN
ncbi:MAG TPA: TlpA disulfide reductase family protein [bacterium]|nr:TlpA disulfide reductase family protein [bacterium]HPN43147.1 TlpA disulfide reductase family protein [bacterium]